MLLVCTLADSGFFFRLLVSRWREATVSGIFEDLKFKISYAIYILFIRFSKKPLLLF